LGNGYASALPHQAIIVAWGWLGVCDGGHRPVVMKKWSDTDTTSSANANFCVAAGGGSGVSSFREDRDGETPVSY